MKHLRKLILPLLALVMVISLCACSETETAIAYTFEVDTGDSIKVELDTTDKFSMTAESPFVIKQKDEVISQGTFAQNDTYDIYRQAVDADDTAEILEEGTRDDCKYFIYTITADDSEAGTAEFNYVIHVNGSNTCILLGNLNSQESATTVFNRLIFSVQKDD